jgi:hypothetical protein
LAGDAARIEYALKFYYLLFEKPLQRNFAMQNQSRNLMIRQALLKKRVRETLIIFCSVQITEKGLTFIEFKENFTYLSVTVYSFKQAKWLQ